MWDVVEKGGGDSDIVLTLRMFTYIEHKIKTKVCGLHEEIVRGECCLDLACV